MEQDVNDASVLYDSSLSVSIAPELISERLEAAGLTNCGIGAGFVGVRSTLLDFSSLQKK